MSTVVTVGLLLVSIGGLALGAELLVRGAVELARRLGVSSFFIGLTIVGFGTSTPELFASVLAGRRGEAGLAVGNVIGSNIFNVAAILGIAALLRPLAVHRRVVRAEVPVVIAVSLVPFVAMLTHDRLERWSGGLMLVGLALYVLQGYRLGRRTANAAGDGLAEMPGARTRLAWSVLLIVAGLTLLITGASGLVHAASTLARAFGVSELAIGLTIVAFGTSAPELVTSVMATVRGHQDLSVGNVLGSNVFNILGVLGLTAAIEPQALARQALWFDAPVMVLAALALVPIMATGGRISRGEGAVLLAGYALYVVALFVWAPRWFPA